MPAKVKVKIISGRNLPVMDRSGDTTDAYVEIKLGSTTYKTDVCRKSLNPQWNSEWYRFEVDDSDLQDEPLQIRLMDHDTYSANDAIGKVYLDLNPLLLPIAGWNADATTNNEHSMSGWIPVYDTMHGIRGEVHINVKVELFSDFNRFRQSSCGIQFFCSKSIPHGFFAQTVHGFVEELIVNDDPEYQWIDKIRTPRASNEARQTLFFKLSGELQRKIGVKALEMGGNAVVGYCQCFDLEGESGIVARGIGTAVSLIKLIDVPSTSVVEHSDDRAESYLKFLGANAGFRLNPHPADVPSNQLQFFLYSKLTPQIDNPRYRQLASNLYGNDLTRHHFKHHSKSNPSLSEDIHRHSVKTLLRQEDMRGTPGYGFGQKIKNLKYSSHHMLSKKMIALKAKLGDVGIGEEEDSGEISTENVAAKKRNPFKFKRTIGDQRVMAQLLATSVIHAHNSLSCILESQDAWPQGDNEEREAAPEQCECEPFQTNERAPTEVQSSSSEVSSSSDDDEDVSDSSMRLETVSNIVKTVEILEKAYKLQGNGQKTFSKQHSLPAIPLNDRDRGAVEEAEAANPFDFIQYTGPSDGATETCEETEDSNAKAPIATSDPDSDDDDVRSTSAASNITDDNRTIIPGARGAFGSDGKRQSLVKTAIQTMLLDKLNLIGTYTPPVSPTSPQSNIFTISPSSSSSSIAAPNKDLPRESIEGFLDAPEALPRSSTVMSLIAWSKTHETVLGAPFVSMQNVTSFRRQRSHPCLPTRYYSNREVNAKNIQELARQQRTNCFSDGELHKSEVKRAASLRTIDKNKSKFIALLGKGQDIEKNANAEGFQRRLSHDNLPKKKFNFFNLTRRKSHEPQTNLKEVKSDDLHKRKFYFLGRHRKTPENDNTSTGRPNKIAKMFTKREKKRSDEDVFKKHGFVGTALGNVVMETVQDILATSNTDNNKETQHSDPTSISLSSVLINTNNDNVLQTPLKTLVPVSTETDKGTGFGVNKMHASLTPSLRNSSPVPETQLPEQGHHRTESVGTKVVQSPAKLNALPNIHRRSSDSDLSITPKGNSLTGSDRSGGGSATNPVKLGNISRSTVPRDNFDMLEYPFLTLSKYPPGFILQLGGSVSARSVKLLERTTNVEEPEPRDIWWSEIRLEIRSHARSLNCNAVLGYTETTSICDEVCVLSASGTAAVIGYHSTGDSGTSNGLAKPTNNSGPVERNNEVDKAQKPPERQQPKVLNESPEQETVPCQVGSCTICHLPYNTNNILRCIKCPVCRNGNVPEVLIATIETPEGIPTAGRGCFIQSFISRQLKDSRGESNAKDISDGLPFLEYELHRVLMNKLKIKAMNAIFGLKIRISIGDKMLVGIATGTAMFLTPLPNPNLPKIVSERSSDQRKLNDIQKMLTETVKKNREIYQLKNVDDFHNGRGISDDDSEEEPAPIDLSLGSKDCCMLQMDDPEDAEVLRLLMEERPPDGFHVVNTEFVPGIEELEIVKNLQMFTQIYRTKIQPPYNFESYFRRLLQSVYFKLRRMVPCALCDLQFRVDLPEPDEIQLCVLGMALGLDDMQKMKVKRKSTLTKKNDDELIFNLEEDQIPENGVPNTSQSLQNYGINVHSTRHRQKSPSRRMQAMKSKHIPYKERHVVDITPLSYVPGGKIEHYLGNLNFFFIRETTSLREEGGLSGFIHSFVTEVLAIVRAHVTALGGNAMVAYFMTECVLNHNLHKNQGQCLINVGGDVVFVSYFREDP